MLRSTVHCVTGSEAVTSGTLSQFILLEVKVARTKIEIEYVVCLKQEGFVSHALRSHRNEGGTPALYIDSAGSQTVWTLESLNSGVPEAPGGSTARIDRVDFYILNRDLERSLPHFPAASSAANLGYRLPVTDSRGTERDEGKHVRPLAQVGRYHGVSRVHWEKRHESPTVSVAAENLELHLDVEMTPKADYGETLPETHFGFRGEYVKGGLAGSGSSSVVIHMPHDLYALVLRDLPRALY